MRACPTKVSFPLRAVSGSVLLAMLFFSLVPGPSGCSAVGDLVYVLQRQLRHRALTAPFEGLASLESDHFIIRYDPTRDAGWAPAVLDVAEGAREAVSRRLGWTPAVSGTEKVTILLYADERSLDEQFAGRPGFRALGAYWCGAVQILSPRLWLTETPTVDARRRLWSEGPLVHECTHYLLDRLVPHDNYPRWLSEGLAQYVEYRETGYLWLDDDNVIAVPLRKAALYGLADLDQAFDRLENTALAYREAFLLVAYLEDTFGQDRVNLLLAHLADGARFADALRESTGMTPVEIERIWLRWLDDNLTRYSTGPGKEAQLS